MPVRPYRTLFLCAHNSARSIIAEAVLRKIAGAGSGRRFEAFSAGSEPASAPLPAVIERLEALGYDTTNLASKSWHDFVGADAPRMDFVITMCDILEHNTCPDFGDQAATAAWPFPDPAKFRGSDTEHAAMINELIGMIRRRLEIFISLPFDTLDRMALEARLDEIGKQIRA